MKSYSLFILVYCCLFSCTNKKSSSSNTTDSFQSVFDSTKMTVVYQKTDTVNVTFEYEATGNIVKYEEGHIVRNGLFSPAFKDGWRNFTDHLYTSDWKLFTGTILRLSIKGKDTTMSSH